MKDNTPFAKLKRSNMPLTVEEMAEIREHMLGSTKSIWYPELPDEALIQLIKEGFTQTAIAQRWDCSVSTVSRRVAKIYSEAEIDLEAFISTNLAANQLANPEAAAEAAKKIWDAKGSYEENYSRLIAAYHGALRTSDRIRAAAEIRKHLDSTQKAAQTIYNSERVTAFLNEVIDVFRRCDPNLQSTLMAALAARGGDCAILSKSLAQTVSNSS
ncbi:MAG TPA: helix-turn-helix domain-containing protein [Capsulimonadaceae bacterium]|jgi:hypothetical protein